MEKPISLKHFRIRETTSADVPLLAALHVKTFNETHGASPNGPTYETREGQWRKMFQDKDDSWFCLVIEGETKKLIGFAKGQPYNHSAFPQFSGELNKIYILSEYHHSGLGRWLICNVAREFIRRGVGSMLLFGDAHNPSNGFYEKMEAQRLFAPNGDFHGGYGWTELERLVQNSCKTIK